MNNAPQKTNITQSTFYSKPYEEIRRKHSSIAEYELDHLATLTISPRENLETTDDGMRRLQQMISTSCVWTMRVYLRVTPKDVIVVEKKTGKELDIFPANHIYDPVCYRGSNKHDQSKQIVIFIVRGDTANRSRNEMHIFQSLTPEDETLVDDLKAASIGMFPRTRNSEEETLFNQPPIRSSRSAHEEDVNLLNSCLDFIESFVVSIQKAAHAHKQLLLKQEQGSGNIQEIEYLTKRSIPPSNDEFVEVLRQFKFTFNLLPKLKNFLKDPNAPELARHLFHPLSIVVDSCRDSQLMNAKLPTVIVSPLLTLDACNLLHSCLHPPQAMLWKELGAAWSTPTEKWTGTPPEPYYPSFQSRTKPGKISSPSSSLSSKDSTNSRSVSKEQNEYLASLKSKRADIYQAKVTRIAEPTKTKELSIKEGEYLEMLQNPPEKGWWKVANIANKEGFVPKTIIQKINY